MLAKVSRITVSFAVLILCLSGCMKGADDVYTLADDSRSDYLMEAAFEADPNFFSENADRGSASQALQAPDYGDRTLDEVVEVIRSHSVQTLLPFSTDWFLRTSDDNPLDEDTILGGGALAYAAMSYAMHTLDFHVTLRDLIDSGYWPYLLLPPDVDLDATVRAERVAVAYGESGFAGPMFDQLGSPEWVLKRKAMIVAWFYSDVVTNYQGPVYQSGSLTGNTNPSFWINPLTGLPMKESQERGDYTFYSNKKASSDTFRVRGFTEELWPYVNQSSAKGNSSKRSVSNLEQCCLFEIRPPEDISNEIEEITWCCPCGETETCCEIRFIYNCQASKSRYVFVEMVDCSTSPTTGQDIVQYGQHTQPTSYGGSCEPTFLSDPCVWPACPSSPAYDACVDLYDRFMSSMSGTHVGDAQGDKCECE